MGRKIKSNRFSLDLSAGLVVPAAAGSVSVERGEFAAMYADVIAAYGGLDNAQSLAAWDCVFLKRFRLWSPWVAIGAALYVDPAGASVDTPNNPNYSHVYFHRGQSCRANVACLGEWVDIGESLDSDGSEGASTTLDARLAENATLYFPTPPADAVGLPVRLLLQVEVSHTLPVGGWA